jgi:hypothetical protein
MSDLIPKDTDEEIERYMEADMVRRARMPMAGNAALKYEADPVTGRENAYFPLSAGGYVKIGDRAVTPVQAAETDVLAAERDIINEEGVPITDIERFARGAVTMDDYLVAGFTEAQVRENEARIAATRPVPVQLTEEQIQFGEEVGAPMLKPEPPGLFEGTLGEIGKGLVRGGLIEPARFLKENFNIYDPLYFQVIDPETGEFAPRLRILSRDEYEAMSAGEMPGAINLEDLFEPGDASQTGPGAAMLGSVSQFVGAYAGLGKLFRVGSGFIGGATQGAAADFLGFGGDEGRLTDLLLELGVPDNMLTDFMRTDPNDPDYVGRFKNALEGGVLGALAEQIGPVYRMIKGGGSRTQLGQAIGNLRDRSKQTFSNTISDIIGTGRAVMQGDREMLGEIFQPAGTPRSLGAAAPGETPPLGEPGIRPLGERTIELSGRLATPREGAAANISLAPPSEDPMVGQLAPQYRVRVEGFTPEGTGKQSFIPRKLTPNNSQATITRMSELAEEYPDPLSSPESYAGMMARARNAAEVPAPPSWMIENANNMEEWSGWFSGLTPDQIRAADEGLAVQNDFKTAYQGGAGPELTGQLMLWSILSRMLSAFPHESGFLELAENATPFIQRAARGEWTDADTQAWLEMVPSTIPADSPGRSATSNANAFGETFLRKMAATDEEGRSALLRLHEMIADPNMSSAEIRRLYYGLAEDTGIANKILSFALLVSGRNDVVVLDRIQINRMWAGGDKVYDDIMGQFEGAQGLAQYEALERSLAPRIEDLYRMSGREGGSVGRYHWESWVLSSGQVVSHPTLGSVVRAGQMVPEATTRAPVMEGRFHRWNYGVRYERTPGGGNRYVYETSAGEPFQFTKAELDAMFKEVQKRSSGVLPPDFPGVSSFEGGDIPWYQYKGVNREKLDEIIRQSGKPVTE